MKLIEVTRQFNTDDRNPKSKARTHPSQTPRRVGHPQNRLLASKAGAPGKKEVGSRSPPSARGMPTAGRPSSSAKGMPTAGRPRPYYSVG
jgi:hypothetical protein